MTARFESIDWFPLSVAQQSRLFLYQLAPETRGNHNNVFVATLRGQIEPAQLRDALDRLIARHPMLRTQMRWSESGVAEQRVLPRAQVRLQVEDVAGLDADALMARVTADAWEPFDIAHPPLLRAALYLRTPTEAVFLLALDHLVCDGWSYWTLLEELGALISGEQSNHPEITDSAPEYRDYVMAQREWLLGPRAQKQLAYWTKALGDAQSILQLPLDRAPGARSSGRQAIASVSLSAGLTDSLRSLGSAHGATLFNVLLVAYQILLHRYSGQDRIIVGSPVPARGHARWDKVIGDFVNIVALASDMDGDPTVGELLKRSRSTVLRAMLNQDFPFSRLVEQLHPAHDSVDHPIFQTAFVFQNPRRASELGELWNSARQGQTVANWGAIELSTFPMAHRVANDRIALSLHAMEINDHVRCDFTYDVDVLDAATVERMAANFRVLLESMATGAEQPAGRLHLLTVDERAQVLEGFNQTELELPALRLIHPLFEEQVRQRPDAPALRHGGLVLSYDELNRRANRLAHQLILLGVKPDDRVGLSVSRTPDMVVGLLAILKAGGAYVPLDPNYPVDRLALMLSDSAPRVILARGMAEALLAGVDAPVLDPGQDWDAGWPEQNPDPRELGLDGSHLAYVIYTSGSTGVPKGVAIEHRNTVNLITWARASFSSDELSETLFATSVNFDLAVFELLVPLCSGHAVTLVDDVLAWESRSQPVSLVNTVPSGISAVLASHGLPADTVLVNLAGEPLKQQLVDRIFASSAVESVANLYGPTETTTYSTWLRIERVGSHAVTIGRPIANTRIYLLDAHQQPVPIGVAGEIHIGGAGVARGYLHRPELSSERFLGDPFVNDPDARMYRTGDLGRWRADGSIEYLGRNDFQIKLRGFRIELGEIESCLAGCEGVHESAVVAREDVPGDQRLVAYLVSRDAVKPSIAELREAMSRRLAEYMIPAAFVFLDALPLTPNGKLDRKALPAPDQDSVLSAAFEAPIGDTERAIAQIWQSLLGLDRVGRRDHFFALGGNSLLALQVVSRLRQQAGVDVALRDLFARPTLAGFGEAVSSARGLAAQRIKRADRSKPLPLSWAQQRLWFLSRLNAAAAAAYHMPAALSIRGNLDRAALKATLDRIVARHESLRTRFVAEAEVPMQCIAPADVGFALVEQDLRGLDPLTRTATVERITADEASAAFDLETGPLIRGRLLILGDEEHVLLVTQHHIVSDGWSIGILVREVSALYGAYAQAQPDPLPELEIQYPDYAVWQQQQFQGDALKLQTEFWCRHLGGAPALLELPTDRPRPGIQTYAGNSLGLTLPASLVQSINELAQRSDSTQFMVLLAAWSVVLARMSGQDEIVVGTPVANRQLPETEALIGYFVNTLALRVRLDADPTVADLLAQVRTTALDAYEHQTLPFEQVVEALQPPRSLSHSPVFQTMLALNNTAGSEVLRLPGLELEPLAVPQRTTRVDLTLMLREREDGLLGEIEYASDLFDRDTIAAISDRFLRVLEAMICDETQRVSALPLLGEQEKLSLLRDFNVTDAAYPAESNIPAQFALQLARDPDAIALVCGNRRLSYAEVERCANRIAHALLESGIKSEDRVAIVDQRSVEIVIGKLGILKAGAAYVPLDPDLPAERLLALVSDSAAVALLTRDFLCATPWAQDCASRGLIVLELDSITASADFPDHAPPVPELGPRNLAYVMYTSGSTGRPKGVMVEHRSVLRLVINNHYAPIDATDCVAHCANPAFDASTWEVWSALLNGARVLVVPPSVVLDPPALCKALVEGGVSALWLTVGLFNEYVDLLGPAFAKLKHLLVGGDALDPRTIARLLRSPNRPQHLVNGYGPTETTTFAITHAIESVSEHARSIPIGKPIANTRIHILDGNGQLVPVGVKGEIHIGGPGVARGYLNQPELTAERFIADPYSNEHGARLYRTGDLGRWLADGSIEYLGRNDFQVKIRGFRIELGEIEARLAACEGVRESVVLAHSDERGDKRLLAWIVAEPGAEPSIDGLRRQLSAVLPDYMVPAAIVRLDGMPLTANGKVDRRALPLPGQSAYAQRDYEAPLGESEQAMALLWQDLLGIARVGRHDHFFELGGHSLLAMRLATRIREQFHVDLPLSGLFENPVLSALASAVRTLQLQAFLSEDLVDMQSELDSLSEEELLEILKRESVDE